MQMVESSQHLVCACVASVKIKKEKYGRAHVYVKPHLQGTWSNCSSCNKAGQRDEEEKPDMLSLAVFSQSARLQTEHSVSVCFV